MTTYVTNQGEEAWLDRIFGVNYSLRLFTNDVLAGLTAAEIDALTAADLTQATFPGYAAVTLSGGSWVTTEDDPSTAVYAQQTFSRTSTGTPQSVYGYYLLRSSDSELHLIEDFGGPVVIENNGDAITVIPRVTMGDEEDDSATARGIIAEFVGTTDTSGMTADTVTDMAISNVPWVAGRKYGIHLHTQYALATADGAWNLLFRVNASTVDRFARIFNNSDAVGTFGTKTDTLDVMVFYEPTDSFGTDDIDVFADETSDGSTLTLNGAGTAQRTLTVIDLGLAP